MNQYQFVIGDYTIDTSNLLGKGACGSVFTATKKGDPIQYCAKIIQGTQITSEKEMKLVQFLQTKQNENIVNFYYCNIWEEKGYIVIIMEKCDSDLEKERKSRPNQKYTENEAINIMKQLFNGYKILYNNNVIHRDIKPANIFIQQGIYKIGDFGLGRIYEKDEKLWNLTKVGVLVFKAPELQQNYQWRQNDIQIQERDNTNFIHKVDIYSFGMLFYLLLTGTYPFSLNNQAISEFINKINYQPFKVDPNFGISQRIANLIERMMLYSPIERVSFEDICNQYQEFSTRIGTLYNVKDFHFIPFKPPQINFNPSKNKVLDWIQNFRQLFNDQCNDNDQVVQIYQLYCDGLLQISYFVIEQINLTQNILQEFINNIAQQQEFDIEINFPLNLQDKSFYLVKLVNIIKKHIFIKIFTYNQNKNYSEQRLRLIYILWKLCNNIYCLPFQVSNINTENNQIVNYQQFQHSCADDFVLNKEQLRQILDQHY